MAKRNPLTAGELAALVDRADDLAHALKDAEERWPHGLEDRPFPEIEREGQTINRLAESALGLQRMLLFRVALEADARRLKAELLAR